MPHIVPTPWVIDGWMMVDTARTTESGEQVRHLVSQLASDAQTGFVSPVFLDEHSLPMLLTPEILVRFNPQVPAARAEAVLANSIVGEITHRNWAGMNNAFRVQVSSRNGFDVLDAANTLAELAEVKWSEPNMILQNRQGLIPNDPSFGDLWGIRNTGQSGGQVDFDMDGDEAWDITTGDSGITVVVIDNGVQQNHPDIHQLAGNDLTGNNTNGGPFSGCDDHGTAVAGCVSATIDNSTGVVGIAPDCFVRSAKVFTANVPCDGNGTFFINDMVQALDWASTIGAEVTVTIHPLINNRTYSP